MAFTNAHKAAIRKWLGYSVLFSQTHPELEGQLAAIDAIPDGGETANLILGYLDELLDVETQMKNLRPIFMAAEADKDATIDPVRARLALCAEGRRLAGHLSDACNIRVLRDVFSAPAPLGREEANRGNTRTFG